MYEQTCKPQVTLVRNSAHRPSDQLTSVEFRATSVAKKREKI